MTELLKRFVHKNYIPITILINGAPYFFPNSWVEEQYQLGSAVQYSSKKDEPLMVMPTERSISLSIRIPMDQIFHKSYYNICKQAIKAATLLCTTTKSYRNESEIKGSQEISIFDSMSYKFPIKKGKAESFQASNANTNISFQLDENVTAKSNKPSIIQKAEAINTKAKNSHASDKDTKPKVNFSNVNLPHWLPVACGVFGYSVQSLGCILTSFTSKSEPENSREIWNIELVEFEWRHQEEDSQNPVELKESQIEIGQNESSINLQNSQYTDNNPLTDPIASLTSQKDKILSNPANIDMTKQFNGTNLFNQITKRTRF